MAENIPTLEEFKAACRHEFAYLVNEFGFVDRPLPDGIPVGAAVLKTPDGQFSNPFFVRFSSDVLSVEIIGDGWGTSACVKLYLLDGRWEYFGNGFRKPFTKAELKALQRGGQLAYVAQYARDIRQYAADLLRGDLARLEALISRKDRERERERGFLASQPAREASEKAKAAFSKGDYRTVIQLLTPHVEKLTTSDLRKLEYAKTHAK